MLTAYFIELTLCSDDDDDNDGVDDDWCLTTTFVHKESVTDNIRGYMLWR